MTQTSSQRPRSQDGVGAPPLQAAPGVPLTAADSSRALWFGSKTEPLFGMYHPPRHASQPRRLGIVLCPPFGYEAMCAHRPYRRLAEDLASQGFAVLRFDYHGTGSSAGDDRDPGRVGAWSKSIDAAIAELARLSGCARVGLFGARLGANLAALAAERSSDVAAVALWGPTLTGNTFLREELAVHKLRAQQRAAERHKPVASDQDGEALGFVLTAETARDIKAIHLDKLTRAPASALVLTRDTPLQEARVAKRLEDLGAQVRCEPASGYTEMLDTSLPPAQIWQRVVSYFDERDRALGDDLPLVSDAAPLTAAETQVSPSSEVRETACWFGPERRLFGVLSEHPARARRDRPVVLLLSGGVNPQVGTNRMHTRWARSWAELGWTTFRFDQAGIGDSGRAKAKPKVSCTR